MQRIATEANLKDGEHASPFYRQYLPSRSSHTDLDRSMATLPSKSTMPSRTANEMVFSEAEPILLGILQPADIETTQFQQRESSS